MPKVTMTFNLPEESEEFRLAHKGINFSIAIDEFREHMRRKYKHTDPLSEAAYKEFEELQTEFFRIMNEHNVFED